MKIALLGYGKMGKEIEKIALDRNHDIVLKIDKYDSDYNIQLADVAIDFSVPEAAVNNISNCLKNGVPVVSGTTGWLKQFDSMTKLCKERDGAFLYASNFSLGVNIFFELNRQLTRLMKGIDGYSADIEEIHHIQKLDAPSGTAITLAQDIIRNSSFEKWELDADKESGVLPLRSKREGQVPGTHHVNYISDSDRISISHEAFNRSGFALGAVMAAEWIRDKSGIFSMKDVLNIG